MSSDPPEFHNNALALPDRPPNAPNTDTLLKRLPRLIQPLPGATILSTRYNPVTDQVQYLVPRPVPAPEDTSDHNNLRVEGVRTILKHGKRKTRSWFGSLGRSARGIDPPQAAPAAAAIIPEGSDSQAATGTNENRQGRKRLWYGSLGRRSARDSGVAGMSSPWSSEATAAPTPEQNDSAEAIAGEEDGTTGSSQKKMRYWFRSLGRSSA
ncbi:hypothetical protein CC86DRAFT_399699 [Ophiobolus disseminans]|uniref:Uncharacterized protein n=1 Tax=Ophiobolus disseminans TaxID=1469910 RepID=A0A6A7AK14_9PLEO|nr:hypothetical protein CC86DRAFT_399699 [Ophiobolus disseminans]